MERNADFNVEQLDDEDATELTTVALEAVAFDEATMEALDKLPLPAPFRSGTVRDLIANLAELGI